MEEIKIWSVDGSQVEELPTSGMGSEKSLEETLVSNPELLMPGLKLVGRQTPVEGGWLDLLGLDEEGKLVVFELKKNAPPRVAVAQVIDYASYIESLEGDVLRKLIETNSGQNGIQKIEDFEKWYADNPEWDSSESPKPVRMALVGLGVDDTTERMVKFLSKVGKVDISLFTFQAFKHADKTLLARQPQVETSVRPVDVGKSSRSAIRQEIERNLFDQARRGGVEVQFNEAVEMFKDRWERPRQRPIRVGLNFRLRVQYAPGKRGWRWCGRVDPGDGRISVVFHSRAIELCKNDFREAINEIPFDTYPRGRKSNPIEISGTEIEFQLTPVDWELHKKRVSALASAVYDGLQLRSQGATLADVDDPYGDEEEEE